MTFKGTKLDKSVPVFVYALAESGVDGGTEKSIFYVGITQNLNSRLSQHISDVCSSAYKMCRIVREQGGNVEIIKLAECPNRTVALAIEHLLISHYKNLVNRSTAMPLALARRFPKASHFFESAA